ncbi:EamA family transporter [Parasedimentitalea psychrophila]|uniref:EamA family transporter n=1 Tax=Parasedimentitalea psychrophila TaxID=2997337 RepID=A0A9Y2KXM6_9RHOB|nr:EamA family transporter [Parasedimentitalea psychrophila]WIY25025.1 EamA family transporter [Parasedimentitalea psychrophila]
MDNFWILLVLASALLHPFRDLTLKGVAHPVSCYVGVCLSWVIFAGAQATLSGQSLRLPLSVWPLVILSALGLGFYYYGTLAAVRRGNLSVYYPIIRSSPIAIVIISWLFLGQSYAWITLAGVGLIILAGLGIQKPPGGLLEDAKAFGLAVMAMIASAVYALADAVAMQDVAAAPFLFSTYILVTLMLAAARSWEDRHLSEPFWGVIRGWQQAPWRILFAGATSYVSYLLILKAFQLGAETAAVSSVRQASIPISVIMAAVILKEPRFLKRIGWACLLALGIILVAFS